MIAYDREAGVWYVHSSAVPGLTGEGVSVEDLIEELQVTVAPSPCRDYSCSGRRIA
jgi:predicted RNase H-like HicB family nuclease